MIQYENPQSDLHLAVLKTTPRARSDAGPGADTVPEVAQRFRNFSTCIAGRIRQ
jgi:hypothetical protein